MVDVLLIPGATTGPPDPRSAPTGAEAAEGAVR
jgi:hypothetical protein